MAHVGHGLFARGEARASSASSARLRRALARVAAHDWMLGGHLFVLLAFVSAGHGRTKTEAIGLLLLTLAWLGAAVALGHSDRAPGGLRSLFYRLSLVGVTVVTYLELRSILAVAADGVADAQLLALDLRVFGVEPALAWDGLVTPARTEWFSFFYGSYFALLAAYAIPIASAFPDGKALREFAFGLLFVFSVGHVSYVLVPALGPYAHLTGFRHELSGSLFWPLVKDAVDGAGAGKDVFPSLHTAAPLFLALYSYRHRAHRVLRAVAPLTAFVASQIVVATMFLRWHYLVDVVAGAVLAVVASVVAARVSAWEESRRRRLGLPAAFPPSPIT